MHVVICAEMPWTPSIGRNHLLARSAAADGLEATFVEGPLDVRWLRSRGSARAWWRAARLRARVARAGVEVITQATLVPGHRSRLAARVNALALRRALAAATRGRPAVLVATAPWHWPAVAAVPGARRVYDCGDDWGALIPHASAMVVALHERIAAEADAVVLVSDELAGEFRGAEVHVIPNGVDDRLLEVAGAPARERCVVYTGTLSERFDAPFLGDVLERLPGWELELYGRCQYAGRGEEPAPELRALLDRHPGRARWLGPVPRERLAEVLDRAQVLVAAHRPAQVRGQSSMKLYDYASRRRPIVGTPGAFGALELVRGAGVCEAATPEEFAAAVRLAGAREGTRASVDWLERHRWSGRWRRWRAAALGASSR
jgi:hypothetical protein